MIDLLFTIDYRFFNKLWQWNTSFFIVKKNRNMDQRKLKRSIIYDRKSKINFWAPINRSIQIFWESGMLLAYRQFNHTLGHICLSQQLNCFHLISIADLRRWTQNLKLTCCLSWEFMIRTKIQNKHKLTCCKIANSHKQLDECLKDVWESSLLTFVLKHHAPHRELHVTQHLPLLLQFATVYCNYSN